MKKIFTLFVALFAFAFCVKAQQVTVILEAHDVWQDGSGYQLLLDADHNAYGTVIPQTGALTSSATQTVDYSTTFEYMIPTNAEGNVNTSNVVVDDIVTITIPAGTYDFCITNPTPGDRIWIAAGENGRKDDYVFDPAFTYHFTVALNEATGNDAVTIEKIPVGSDPLISVSETSLNMTTVVATPVEATVNVSAYNLTADITATTSAPFEVSANGTSFGTTATLDQNGGTLYVRYTPTAGGTDNGMVTLSSTGATNVSITLVGEGIDCNNITAPYTCTFASEAENACWTIVDANQDANANGYGQFNFGNGFVIYPYSPENQTADDWLISPAISLGATASASFDYAAYSANYPEKFAVYVITAGHTYEDAIEVVPTMEVTNTEDETLDIDLSAYANQTIQIAIHCESNSSSNEGYYFYVSNFNVSSEPLSINEVENTVSVYPNPANNVIKVNASSNISKVEVYSISGQKVGDFTANGTSTSINTSNLSAGLYMMRINTENGVVNQKFSVAR